MSFAKSIVCLIATVALICSSVNAQPTTFALPPIPADETFVNDYANVLSDTDIAKIGWLQETAFNDHDTPIIVVTIHSMLRYGRPNQSIEQFAAAWFNHWQIGKRAPSGETINRGILLLISIGDRKARIELGADWGRRWDGYCQQIMDDQIIPHFKAGNYPNGILAGVEALADMSTRDPSSKPPISLISTISKSMTKKPLPMNPVPLWGIIGLVVFGIFLIVTSFKVSEEKRHTILTIGIFIIAGAFFFWFVLIFLMILMRGFGWLGGNSGGGGFSGGGFGSGGFSGGGGASGSW